MPKDNQSKSSADNQSDSKAQNDKLSDVQKGGSEKEQAANQQSSTQDASLNAEEPQKAQGVEQQIQNFEQQLESKSNSDLKQIATKLETAERSMLLEKIDNQVQTIKDTIVKPGDGASTAAAGAATVAVTANTQTETTPV